MPSLFPWNSKRKFTTSFSVRSFPFRMFQALPLKQSDTFPVTIHIVKTSPSSCSSALNLFKIHKLTICHLIYFNVQTSLVNILTFHSEFSQILHNPLCLPIITGSAFANSVMTTDLYNFQISTRPLTGCWKFPKMLHIIFNCLSFLLRFMNNTHVGNNQI